MRYSTAAAAEQADDSPVLFRFTYRSMPCRVVAEETAITLQADMGILPFTGDGPSLRSDLIAVLNHARRTSGYHVRFAPDHRFGLTVALTVGDDAPPASILAAAIAGLAGAKPLIDVVLSLLPKHLRHRMDSSRSAA